MHLARPFSPFALLIELFFTFQIKHIKTNKISLLSIAGVPKPELVMWRYNDSGEVVYDVSEGVEMNIDCKTNHRTLIEDVSVVIRRTDIYNYDYFNCTMEYEGNELLRYSYA